MSSFDSVLEHSALGQGTGIATPRISIWAAIVCDRQLVQMVAGWEHKAVGALDGSLAVLSLNTSPQTEQSASLLVSAGTVEVGSAVGSAVSVGLTGFVVIGEKGLSDSLGNPSALERNQVTA